MRYLAYTPELSERRKTLLTFSTQSTTEELILLMESVYGWKYIYFECTVVFLVFFFRKMCPFKKDNADVEPAAAPYLQKLAVDMLKDKLELKEVQLRLNIDAAAAIDIKS